MRISHIVILGLAEEYWDNEEHVPRQRFIPKYIFNDPKSFDKFIIDLQYNDPFITKSITFDEVKERYVIAEFHPQAVLYKDMSELTFFTFDGYSDYRTRENAYEIERLQEYKSNFKKQLENKIRNGGKMHILDEIDRIEMEIREEINE